MRRSGTDPTFGMRRHDTMAPENGLATRTRGVADAPRNQIGRFKRPLERGRYAA